MWKQLKSGQFEVHEIGLKARFSYRRYLHLFIPLQLFSFDQIFALNLKKENGTRSSRYLMNLEIRYVSFLHFKLHSAGVLKPDLSLITCDPWEDCPLDHGGCGTSLCGDVHWKPFFEPLVLKPFRYHNLDTLRRKDEKN